MLKVPIGGFYELELPKVNNEFHKDAISLSTGRSCISLILEKEKPTKVYIPFYTCSALYEPLMKYNIIFEFYGIDETLEPTKLPTLRENEIYIYINYFGLKNEFCNNLINRYHSKVVIDNTHNFFHKGYDNTYSFTSARKYFGVPDGAYLYSPKEVEYKIYPRNKNISLLHNILRLEENYDIAYEKYLESEALFSCDILRISNISEKILKTIDYQEVKEKRIKNYNYLHKKLKNSNLLQIEYGSDAIPFCYPLLLSKKIEKRLFHQNNLFIPTLWPDILLREDENHLFEKNFSQALIPIPIDHRYEINDMKNVIKIIKRIIDEQ